MIPEAPSRRTAASDRSGEAAIMAPLNAPMLAPETMLIVCHSASALTTRLMRPPPATGQHQPRFISVLAAPSEIFHRPYFSERRSAEQRLCKPVSVLQPAWLTRSPDALSAPVSQPVNRVATRYLPVPAPTTSQSRFQTHGCTTATSLPSALMLYV